MTLLEQLLFVLRRQPASQDRERAQQHLLDWVACAALGGQTPAGRRLADLWRIEGEAGASTALGLGRGSFSSSVFFNACLGNILEMDDVHRLSVLHPGPIVIPVALAVGERLGSSGADILDAVVRGYEAVIRVGVALGSEHYRYWHTTSTAGAVGAAVAAASLYKFPDEQWLWAMGNAAGRTGGLWQMRHEACDSKQLHNGWSAQIGAQAALAASVGLRGPVTALEGPQGLLAATAAGGLPDQLCADPDGRWQIWDCSFKPWAACRHAHPTIDAALQLKVDPQQVESVHIASYGDALTFCDCQNPETELAAKFSLQHAAAVALVRGVPALTDFDDGSRADPLLSAIRNRCRVSIDPELDRAYPQHYGASVRVELKDGQVFDSHVRDTLGDPERPMSCDDLLAKYTALMSAAGYSADAQDLIRSHVEQLENSDSSALLEALAAVNNLEQD